MPEAILFALLQVKDKRAHPLMGNLAPTIVVVPLGSEIDRLTAPEA